MKFKYLLICFEIMETSNTQNACTYAMSVFMIEFV